MIVVVWTKTGFYCTLDAPLFRQISVFSLRCIRTIQHNSMLIVQPWG